MLPSTDIMFKLATSNSEKLPLLVWCVFFFSLLTISINVPIFGINISGISWTIPLIFSIYIVIIRWNKITFPWELWLPWVLLMFIHLFMLNYALLDLRVSPVQRTAQVLAPLIVGIAVSTYRPSLQVSNRFFRIVRIFAYSVIVAIAFAGRNLFLKDDFSGFAAENMMILLLSVFFANRYLLFNEIKDVLMWLVLLSFPVLAITRTVIAATLLTFPLAMSPFSIIRRLIYLVFVAVVGIGIFNLPFVQQKMFVSGQGELSDIGNNDEFLTSGRSFIWESLYLEAQNEHWLGHGTGAAETRTYIFTPVGYPHNDWLLNYFDYGVIGVVIYILCLLLTISHGFIAQRKTQNKNIKLLLLTGVSAFIPYMIVMYTDNIMVYASFFGMLHYTFLGLGYGALKAEQEIKQVT